VLAKYELYLDKDPNTGTPIENEYKARLIEGKSEDVCFNNYIFGNLTVKKIWRDVKLADDSKNHTELTLYIWQRQHIGETYTDWVIYGTTQLSGENNWTQTVDGLPLRDSKGTFEYLVKEPDNYNSTHLVSYKYNGVEVVQNDQTSEVVIGNDTVNDPGYVMTANNLNYGEVVITNTALSEYALPSTGGNGTWPFAAAGAGMVIISILGSLYFGKKRKS
jgi:LPXTG-motif cell wall-anchored protein